MQLVVQLFQISVYPMLISITVCNYEFFVMESLLLILFMNCCFSMLFLFHITLFICMESI